MLAKVFICLVLNFWPNGMNWLSLPFLSPSQRAGGFTQPMNFYQNFWMVFDAFALNLVLLLNSIQNFMAFIFLSDCQRYPDREGDITLNLVLLLNPIQNFTAFIFLSDSQRYPDSFQEALWRRHASRIIGPRSGDTVLDHSNFLQFTQIFWK